MKHYFICATKMVPFGALRKQFVGNFSPDQDGQVLMSELLLLTMSKYCITLTLNSNICTKNLQKPASTLRTLLPISLTAQDKPPHKAGLHNPPAKYSTFIKYWIQILLKTFRLIILGV